MAGTKMFGGQTFHLGGIGVARFRSSTETSGPLSGLSVRSPDVLETSTQPPSALCARRFFSLRKPAKHGSGKHRTISHYPFPSQSTLLLEYSLIAGLAGSAVRDVGLFGDLLVVLLLVSVSTAPEEHARCQVQCETDRQPDDREVVDDHGHAAGGDDGNNRGDEPTGNHPDGTSHFRLGISSSKHSIGESRPNHCCEGDVGGGNGQPASRGEGNHTGADTGNHGGSQRVIVQLLAFFRQFGFGGQRRLSLRRRARTIRAKALHQRGA